MSGLEVVLVPARPWLDVRPARADEAPGIVEYALQGTILGRTILVPAGVPVEQAPQRALELLASELYRRERELGDLWPDEVVYGGEGG